MASREGVDVWLEDDNLWCDVYLPDISQWVVAHVVQIDVEQRNVLIEYSDNVHQNEWINVDSGIFRLSELGVHTNQPAVSVDASGNPVYIQDTDTQMTGLINEIVDSVTEKYNNVEQHDKVLELRALCAEFSARWLNSSSSSEDILETSMQIPFYDPLTHCAIRVAARGIQCTHAATFDVRSYLEHNIGKSAWKCCICNQECVPFDLDIDIFMLNLLHTTDHKQTQCTITPANMATFVRDQLELGLSCDFDDRYVVIHADGTYQLSAEIQANKQSNKRNGMHIDEHNTHAQSKKSITRTAASDSDIEIIDDHTADQPKVSTARSARLNHTSSSNATQHRTVIDLTQDTHIYDSYIARIRVKEETITARERVAATQKQRMQELQAASAQPIYSVPVCNRVAAGVVALQQQAEKYSVNLNTATAKELTKLPGIGVTTAQRIIQYREERVAKLRQLSPNASRIQAFNQPSDVLSCPKVSYSVLDRLRHLVHC